MQEPWTQLTLLLKPFGIKTVTTGSGEVAQFLDSRYGAHDGEALQTAFLQELERVRTAKVVMIGVPNDNGAGFDRGSKKGPLGIRQSLLAMEGLWEQVTELGFVDIGDVWDHPLLTHDSLLQDWVIQRVRQDRWGEEGKRLELPVSAHSILERVLLCLYALNPDVRVLMLGGDHSKSLIPVSVLAQRHDNLGVLHLDAHTDLLESRDGLAHSYATWAWHANKAIGGGKRMVQVGVRTSGKERGYWEKNLDLLQFWDQEVNDDLIPKICTHFKAIGIKQVYLSNDIDALALEFASATGTPEAGGLSPRFEAKLIRAVGADFELVGSDLVEVAPPLSRNLSGEPGRTLHHAGFLVVEQLRAMLKKELSNPFS